jgi:hypothetical protein
MLRGMICAAFVAALAIGGPGPAAAQDSSGAAAADHLTAEEARAFSKEIEQTLAARGAVVAIVFRAGRPREDLPEGFAYTHGAFWVYQPARLPDGREVKGYAVQNLYSGDGDSLPVTKSKLVQDFPFDFAAGSHEDDVAIIVPTREVQQRLYGVIASPAYSALHVDEYSLVSNPADARYQNCNEFMLDVLAAAVWETADYAQIKVNLAASFKPSRVKAGGLKRLFAPLVDGRLRTGDHDGPVETATFESLAAFMQTHGYAQDVLQLETGGAAAAFTLP